MSEPGRGQPGAALRSPLFMCAVVLGLLTISDLGGLFGGKENSHPAGGVSASNPKEVPAPKYASMMAGPSIKFLYW